MNATHALGWALVHFLWQGAALAILLGIGLAISPPTAARTRYTLSIVTLTAMLILPIATTLRLYEPAVPGDVSALSPSSRTPEAVESPAPRAPAASVKSLRQPPAPSDSRGTRLTQLRDRLEPAVPWLVVVWVLGV